MGMAASMVVLSLILAGFILQALFVANLERSAQQDLEAALSRLVALIDPKQAEPTIQMPLPDPRYETPLGGRYWQIEDLETGSVARSKSLFDQQLPTDIVGSDEELHFAAIGERDLILVSREIEFYERSYRVTVGEDHEPIQQAGWRYSWDIATLFSLVGVAIIGIAWTQLLLGLSPLNRLRTAVDEVRRGETDQVSGRFPSEIQPLVDEVNALLAEREALVDRGRRRASDLAHGLKTPLAAIHGIAMRLRNRGDEAEAEALDELAFEMSNRVDYQMRLAALRTRSRDHRERSSLNTAILRTMTVLRKTQDGELLHWIAELGEDLSVDIHRQDLMELVGVTLENAAKWAGSTVVVKSAEDEGFALVRVSDNGPGIAPDRMRKLGSRGIRYDESVPGNGLGLAIASEILELNGGTISYAVSDQGGLQVEMRLPLARA